MMLAEPKIIHADGKAITEFDQIDQLVENVVKTIKEVPADKPVVLDLSEVEMVASIFLSSLVQMVRQARASNKHFGVLKMQKRVYDVFTCAKLDRMIRYGDNLDDLMSWLAEPADA